MIEFLRKYEAILRKYEPFVLIGLLLLVLFVVMAKPAVAAGLGKLIVVGLLATYSWYARNDIIQVFQSIAGEEDGKREAVEPADDVKAES